ncbi:MAG: DUF1501 domain-containing protein [Phycisphaeraceae bacterium]|nr:DUF1501 domain-containing protein [Phycisphaeraceae bacterium]
MNDLACTGCPEYRTLSRRGFLRAGAAAAAGALAAPAWMPRVAFGNGIALGRDVLVTVFLRGGADGLSMCVPFAEPVYYALRPNTSVPPPGSGADGAINLDGFFGLAPAMSPLLEAWNAGRLAIVHACGLNDPTRSHFDAQRYMELGGTDGPPLFDGWMARHLASIGAAGGLVRGLAHGHAIPASLWGADRTAPVPDPADYGLSGDPSTRDARLEFLVHEYVRAGGQLRFAALNTRSTVRLLDEVDFAGYQPLGGASYPPTPFGQALRTTAAMIRARIGVEAVAIDNGGWDLHTQMYPNGQGPMALRMAGLAQGLAAFHRDVIDGVGGVTVVVMSEFGRRIAENGGHGTDHGHGNAMLVLGRHVHGRRVVTQWPGLADLYDGIDLRITTDYRDVLAEILSRRVGNANLADVFPGYTPTFRGVVY